MWSNDNVKANYASGVHFAQGSLPFKLDAIRNSSDSVLEIGSSWGQCYRYLLSEGIDLGSRYFGVDISEGGVAHSKELSPQGNWTCSDFLAADLGRTFDYIIEKNSIHHMPEPLDCIAKAINLTDKAAALYMRVRSFHPTLSDLETGYFQVTADDNSPAGRYFYNLVNLNELADTISTLDNVRSVSISLAPHDTGRTLNGSVLPDDVFDPREELYYCRLVVTKGPPAGRKFSVTPMRWRPFFIEGAKRPKSIARFFGVRKSILARNR